MILNATDKSTNIFTPPQLTGNLAKSLLLKVEAPIILTVNHTKAKYCEDGIVSSAGGTLVYPVPV